MKNPMKSSLSLLLCMIVSSGNISILATKYENEELIPNDSTTVQVETQHVDEEFEKLNSKEQVKNQGENSGEDFILKSNMFRTAGEFSTITGSVALDNIFIDANLATYIATTLGVSTTDLITQDQLDLITTININTGIENLVGLDYLKNLANLEIADSTLGHVDELLVFSTFDILKFTNTGITSVDGLVHLTNVGTLNIENNTELTNVDGLHNLTTANDIYIHDNDILTNVDGLQSLAAAHDIYIHNNAKLTNVDGLQSITSVNDIYIYENVKLTNVDGLQNITTANDIYIYSDDELTNVDGLHNLISANNITITQNPGLVIVDGLPNLETMNGDLSIRYNVSLLHIEGFDKLHKVNGNILLGGFYYATPSPLISVTAFNNLTEVKNIVIENTPNLETIKGFNRLEKLADLRLRYIGTLRNLDGLQNLKTITGLIDIHDVDSLDDVSALKNVESISGWISMNSNPSLKSMDLNPNLVFGIDSTSIIPWIFADRDSFTDISFLKTLFPLNHGKFTFQDQLRIELSTWDDNGELIIDNPVKNFDNDPITPQTVTGGTYDIVTNTFKFSNSSSTHEFTWSDEIDGDITSIFSGKYSLNIGDTIKIETKNIDISENDYYSPSDSFEKATFIKNTSTAEYKTVSEFLDAGGIIDQSALPNPLVPGTYDVVFSLSSGTAISKVTVHPTYKIMYNLLGGTFVKDYAEPLNFEVTGNEIVLPTVGEVDKTGYSFNGWKNDYTNVSQTVIPTGTIGNQSFTALWLENDYEVTFNANGGTGTMSNQSFTYSEHKALDANTFMKKGYTFVGWNTKIDNTGKFYQDAEVVRKLTDSQGEKVVLYAQWVVDQQTVTWDYNGGFVGTNTSWVDTAQWFTDDIITLVDVPTEPKRVGYTFVGWHTLPHMVIAGENTIVAQWEPNKYVITYDLDEGNNGENNPFIYSYGIGVSHLEPATKEGYAFLGWYDVSGNELTEISSTTLGDITLIAKWAKLYTVKFDTNGGTSIPSQIVVDGDLITEPSTPFLENYDFKGWYTNPMERTLPWNFSKDFVTSDLTLYAHWTPKDIPVIPPAMTPDETLPSTGENINERIVISILGLAISILIITSRRKKYKELKE